jgi:hypothetical protein
MKMSQHPNHNQIVEQQKNEDRVKLLRRELSPCGALTELNGGPVAGGTYGGTGYNSKKIGPVAWTPSPCM